MISVDSHFLSLSFSSFLSPYPSLSYAALYIEKREREKDVSAAAAQSTLS